MEQDHIRCHPRDDISRCAGWPATSLSQDRVLSMPVGHIQSKWA